MWASASADTTVSLSYPVSGSTYINAIHSSIALGPGTLSANADLTTATLTGSVSLPPATGSFTELGPTTTGPHYAQLINPLSLIDGCLDIT